jgi:hypothetical protein
MQATEPSSGANHAHFETTGLSFDVAFASIVTA